MKTDAHIFRILIQVKDMGHESGIIVPETLFLIKQARSEGFQIAHFFVQRLGQADNQARFTCTLSHGRDDEFIHLFHLSSFLSRMIRISTARTPSPCS